MRRLFVDGVACAVTVYREQVAAIQVAQAYELAVSAGGRAYGSAGDQLIQRFRLLVVAQLLQRFPIVDLQPREQGGHSVAALDAFFTRESEIAVGGGRQRRQLEFLDDAIDRHSLDQRIGGDAERRDDAKARQRDERCREPLADCKLAYQAGNFLG